jgi:hypothetical protein
MSAIGKNYVDVDRPPQPERQLCALESASVGIPLFRTEKAGAAGRRQPAQDRISTSDRDRASADASRRVRVAERSLDGWSAGDLDRGAGRRSTSWAVSLTDHATTSRNDCSENQPGGDQRSHE